MTSYTERHPISGVPLQKRGKPNTAKIKMDWARRTRNCVNSATARKELGEKLPKQLFAVQLRGVRKGWALR